MGRQPYTSFDSALMLTNSLRRWPNLTFGQRVPSLR